MASRLNPGIVLLALFWCLAQWAVSAQDTSLSQKTSAHQAGKVNQAADNEAAAWQIRRVVIDPGHGGKDPGCHGRQAREKDIVLGIALELATLLEQQYPGLEVLLTRDEDVFVPLNERAELANKARADLFISIHCNYIRGSAATYGSETYVMGLHRAKENLEVAKRENSVILLEDNYKEVYGYDPDSPEGHIILTMVQHAFLDQSIRFAQMVEEQMAAANRRSRGVKQAGFVVLRQTTMPSVLVETGFLSNRQEEAFLLSEEGQRTVARALAQAFGRYKAEVEGHTAGMPPLADQPLEPAASDEAPAARRDSPARPVSVSATASAKEAPPPVAVRPTPLPAASDGAPPERPSTSILPVEDLAASKSRATVPPQVHFRVQLAASRVPLALNEPRWQQTGFTVEVIQEDGYYKYQAGRFGTFREAFAARRQLQNRGFVDAFVVAYEGTRRISIKEARTRTE